MGMKPGGIIFAQEGLEEPRNSRGVDLEVGMENSGRCLDGLIAVDADRSGAVPSCMARGLAAGGGLGGT